MDAALSDIKACIGRKARAEDVVTAPRIAQLAATLGVPAPASAPGDELPVGWHTPFFVPIYGPDAMRPDGQAAGGRFMPSVPLPRQRIRGDRATFHAPLRIGDALKRTAEIVDASVAETDAGPVVDIVQRLSTESPRGLAVVEERGFFYHGEIAPAPSPLPALPAEAPWRRSIVPDPVLLFRYSAIRFNSHRVHYDRDFSVKEEGLPGLIVHGTLIGQLLLELARTSLPGRPIATFRFDIHRPIYDTGPFEVLGAPAGDGASARLWATDPDGNVAVTAEATLAG